MANDNHEQYDGNDICTYTDLITIGNTLTTEQVDACILAAGEAPADNPKKIYLDNKSSQPGPNSFSPFYFLDPDLWYSEEELVDAKGTWYNYLHTVYASTQQNALATQLKVDNYRNFVTITEYTETINGTPHKYYGLAITTKYGDNNDEESIWTNSILKPMYVLAEGDARTGIFLDEIMCKQEYNFTNSWGSMCTDLGFIQGRRNLKDNESGDIIPYGIWQSGLAPEAYHIEGGHQYGDSYDHHLQWQNNPSTFYTASVYNKIEDLLFIVAIGGLKFEYNNTLYKPIVENGVVVGYTDDMTQTSEWDEWEDIGDHEIPVTPPVPPTPDNPWDVDPETYGWSGGEVSGMVKYYLLTAGQMSSLQTAIRSNANWTIDYLNCIVSCFVVPNNGIFFDAPIPTTVKFKLDNATEWDTGVGCARIQGTKNKSGGTIEIPRLTNTFYDFEPYSDYSVYIPFCGRVPIKGNVCLGREIKVTYYPDVPTCSLTAVVSCGGATIAIAKGSFGTMTPVTSNGSDRKTAAVIGDVSPIITGIGTGIVGVALGNPLIVGAGAAQTLGGIMGGVKETVQSYAYSVGSTGDSSFFSAGNRCFYYANYPLIDEVVDNPMFGHSVGYLCNTVGKLSEFTGFTICANPHVTFSASSEEREEIERLLSMGVIL